MSVTVDVLSPTGSAAGQVSLPDAIFAAPVNVPLIHQVVVAQLAAARQGTHSTKTRAEVSGGGIKPWRQKGTGRARQGSRRAPQWTGGGIVHGPKPRSYAQRTPKKMIAAALRAVLSDRVADNRLYVIDGLVSGDVPSTKQALQALSVVGDYRSALVVLHRDEDLAWLSLRNVPSVHALAVDQLNVYDAVNCQVIIFTKPALDEYLERVGVGEAESVDAGDEVAEVAAPVAPKKAKLAPETPVLVAQSEPETPAVETPPEPETPAAEPQPEPETTTAAPEPEPPAAAPEAPFGEGSYRGDNPPEGFDIKGNEDSMKFHTPASPWYKRTIAEVWFNSAEAAVKAGFVDVMEGKK